MKIQHLTPAGFDLREAEIPVPAPDQIVVQTAVCGICDSDVYSYATRAKDQSLDTVLGHEGSGVVAAVGSAVHEFHVGDVVTSLGIGAFGEYFISSPRGLTTLPENVDVHYALGEPVACCVHASWRFGIKPGDRVAVIGCGFMGLVCLQLARHQGAGFLCAIDPVEWRLEVAQKMGADEVRAPDKATIGLPKNDILAGEFDVVIEAAGVQSALDLSGELVEQHGRIIIVGHHKTQDGLRTVNMNQWNYKALDIVNGHVRKYDEKVEAMREGVALMEQGKLDVSSLVTFYPLSQVQQAFDDLSAKKEGLFKAALIPDEEFDRGTQ